MTKQLMACPSNILYKHQHENKKTVCGRILHNESKPREPKGTPVGWCYQVPGDDILVIISVIRLYQPPG